MDKNIFVVSEKMCIFAPAYASNVSIARKALLILSYCRKRQISRGRTGHSLSLVVYAISNSIPFRREICSMEKPDGFTRFLKGDWRYLDNNGHEHISLMPFLLKEEKRNL